MTRKELQDRQAKYDAHTSKIGQAAAKKYLDSKVQPQSTGLIREIIAGIAILILSAMVLVIGLAL
jgi:hypothetical protein